MAKIILSSAGGASIKLSAGTQTNLGSAFTLSNSNNVSFGLNASTITASASFASSQGAINLSAGTTSNFSSAFTFLNSNGISFGLNAGTITGSIASSLTAINVSAGTTSNNLSAFTLANANGVTFGLNGSVITASIVPPAGQATVTMVSQDADFVTNFQAGLNSLSLQKLSLAMFVSATQLDAVLDVSGVSNASGAVTMSHAVYTLSAGTASLASSGSRAFSWTSGSATTASSLFGGASGTRYRSIPVGYSLSPGNYLFAWALSMQGATVNVIGRAGVSLVGGYDGVETSLFLNGVSTSTVAAFPVSIAATDTGYVRTGLGAMRQPGAILIGTGD